MVRSAAGAAALILCGVVAIALSGAGRVSAASGMPPLPEAGTYKVDPLHSFTYFGAWHHIVGLVRGRFDKVTGTITAGKDPADCAVDISIDTASISTQIGERDDDLRGPDFFDVKKFPAMTYQGKGIRRAANGAWVMDGSLTIRGVTRVVPLTFTFKGVFPDTPAGKPARASFHATAAVKRGDFGLSRDNLMELGPNPKGPDVAIEIDVEADAVPANPQ
ncbi:MAG: YceI family protein [Terracidiphilus sp.]